MNEYAPPGLLFALASDVFDVFDADSGFLGRLLAEAEEEGRSLAEFNFNITDLTVDFLSRTAVISDVLDTSAPNAELVSGCSATTL